MKFLNKYSLFVLFIFLAANNLFAQETQFTMFYASSLYINPALVAQEDAFTFSSNYKLSWPGSTTPHTSNQISAIIPLKSKKSIHNHWGGSGLSFYNRKAGDGSLKTFSSSFSQGYNVPLSHDGMKYVSLGVQVGLIQHSVDFTNLQWGSQFNPYTGGLDPNSVPNEPNVVNNKIATNINAGAIYYYNGIQDYDNFKYSGYIGMSAANLNKPNVSMIKGGVYKLAPLYRLHAGFERKVNDKFYISPNIMLASQNADMFLFAGGYLSYELLSIKTTVMKKSRIMFGSWYKFKKGVSVAVGFSTSNYILAFSYDADLFTDAKVVPKMNKSYEIALILSKPSKFKLKKFSTPRM